MNHLAVRNPKTRTVIVDNFLQLKPEIIEKFLPSVLNLKYFPKTVVAPILENILQSSYFSEGSNSRKLIIERAKRFPIQLDSGEPWHVTRVVVAEMENRTDKAAIDYLIKVMQFSNLKEIRNQILELLKKMPTEKIVGYLPKIFDTKLGNTFIAPFLEDLLNRNNFSTEFSDWYKYILMRVGKYQNSGANSILRIVFNYLRSNDKESFLKLINSTLLLFGEENEKLILEEYVNNFYEVAEKNYENIISKISSRGITRYLNLLTLKNSSLRSDSKYLEFLRLARTELSKRKDLLYSSILDSFIPLIPINQADNFAEEVMNGLNGNPSREVIDLFANMNSDNQLEILSKIIDSYRINAEKIASYLMSNPNFKMSNKVWKFLINQLSSEKSSNRVSNSADFLVSFGLLESPKVEKINLDKLILLLNSKSESVRIKVSSYLGSLSYETLKPYIKSILNYDYAVSVRKTFALALFSKNSLPENSDNRYEFLEIYSKSSTSNSTVALNPILDIVAKDKNPKIMNFIKNCLFHGNEDVREHSLNIFLQRKNKEIIDLLPEISKSEYTHSVVKATAKEFPFFKSNKTNFLAIESFFSELPHELYKDVRYHFVTKLRDPNIVEEKIIKNLGSLIFAPDLSDASVSTYENISTLNLTAKNEEKVTDFIRVISQKYHSRLQKIFENFSSYSSGKDNNIVSLFEKSGVVDKNKKALRCVPFYN